MQFNPIGCSGIQDNHTNLYTTYTKGSSLHLINQQGKQANFTNIFWKFLPGLLGLTCQYQKSTKDTNSRFPLKGMKSEWFNNYLGFHLLKPNNTLSIWPIYAP